MSYIMIKEKSRKDLIKIIEDWLQRISKTSKVNEIDLEIMFVLTCEFKSIIRYDSYFQFKLKCLQMIQEEDYLCFQDYSFFLAQIK